MSPLLTTLRNLQEGIYNVLISKYGVSVRAHVTEGICIPLVAKPDLIRNVTIRGCGRGRST